MAKVSGLGSNLYVAQYDLSGDTGAVSAIEASRAYQEVPAINQSAMDRIPLRKDGNITWTGFWNTTAGQTHPVISALPTTDRIVTFVDGEGAVGSAGGSMVAKVVTYAPAYGADGSLAITTNALANGYGLEWSGGGTGDGMLTTGKQTFASGTLDGTSIDLGSVSTLFGAAAYLHVFSVGSGTPTVTVQDSANNSAFATVTGMAFTASPAATSERVQGAVGATVRRYVRIEVTGTYTNLVCAVNFIRYLTSSAA